MFSFFLSWFGMSSHLRLYDVKGSLQGFAGCAELALGFVGPYGVFCRSSDGCIGSLKARTLWELDSFSCWGLCGL